MRVQGVVVPLVTPWRDQGIDKGASKALVEFLTGAGVNGLFVSGNYRRRTAVV
jgi:dihydrodipicolinate synthase/N-acetylneuraminate lyase